MVWFCDFCLARPARSLCGFEWVDRPLNSRDRNFFILFCSHLNSPLIPMFCTTSRCTTSISTPPSPPPIISIKQPTPTNTALHPSPTTSPASPNSLCILHLTTAISLDPLRGEGDDHARECVQLLGGGSRKWTRAGLLQRRRRALQHEADMDRNGELSLYFVHEGRLRWFRGCVRASNIYSGGDCGSGVVRN